MNVFSLAIGGVVLFGCRMIETFYYSNIKTKNKIQISKLFYKKIVFT